ncbi:MULTISPECIES: AI-2E family transporter [Carboxydocella]|nr:MULTISPECIES: AI-2E family transporter [Carboxydocella]
MHKVKTIARRSFLVGMLLGALFFFWLIRKILLLFLGGWLLAYLLGPLVARMESRGLSRLQALLVLYAIMTGLVLAVAFFLLPVFLRELSQVGEVLPGIWLRWEGFWQNWLARLDGAGLPAQVQKVLSERLGQAREGVEGWLAQGAAGILALAGQIGTILLLPILAFYFLLDWQRLHQGWELLLPGSARLHALALLDELDQIMKKFIRGHLLICLLVGALTGIGMTLLGVPYALFLGVVAGILDLIPFFGPILGGIPAVVLALQISWSKALAAAVVILVIQQVEAHLLSPKILGDALNLHPLTVIFALLAGGEVAGLWGLLLAVPLTAIGKAILRYVFLLLVE